MLWDVDKKKVIVTIPHRREFDAWKARLSRDEVQNIKEVILDLIHRKGDEIATAGWLPENKWGEPPFLAIHEKACRQNVAASGKCFGLFVWEALMEHQDYWSFGRYELNNLPIESMTYFKVHP